MKNLRIMLDDEVARWLKDLAAERNTSVSRIVEGILRERAFDEMGYELAKAQYLSQKPVLLRDSGHNPTRDELHDRP